MAPFRRESINSQPSAPPEEDDADSIVITDEFKHALDLLGTGSNIFLTGKAGTGKSTLIRHFMATTDRNVVVAASTGIAALNVDGYTLHRLFSFQPTTSIDDVHGDQYYPRSFAKALKAMETLIIDEASMVRADVFDMVEASLRRFGPHPGKPFGGVQIVLVGDLLQLPPVVTESEAGFFATRYSTPFFFSADAFDRATFPTVVLTTVFRQRGDQRLAAILNSVREGVLVAEAEQDLASRVIPDFEAPDKEFWLTLAVTNRIATARNNKKLDRLPGDEHSFAALKRGDLTLFDSSTVDDVVRFKVGAQVMMLTNDPAGRWVNGSIGQVTDIDRTTDEMEVTVEFRDGSEATVGPHTWEATRPIVDGRILRRDLVGTYTQLPFKLAWAITIHKSQGQTLDRMIVDLAGGAFASGQVYVALSRCTTMDGLVLRQKVQPKDLKTDRRVLRFLRESTTTSEDAHYCGIAILPIGTAGRLWRPRPVEIAIAYGDGTAISMLVNPQQDLFDAEDKYDVTVADVRLAPTLAEAWSVLGPALEGWTPVGLDIDQTLEHIDYELKRTGTNAHLPIGIHVPWGELRGDELSNATAKRALVRAQSALAAHSRLGLTDPGSSPFPEFEQTNASARFMLTRDPEVRTPTPDHMPGFTDLAHVSRELSAVLLSGSSAQDVLTGGTRVSDVRRLVGLGLTTATAKHLPLPTAIASRLAEVDALLGTTLVEANRSATPSRVDIQALLIEGTTVYFSGQRLDKESLREIAAGKGLIAHDSFTKSRCDILIVAEEGSQSGNAKKAATWGKPVFSLAEFEAWIST